MHYKKQARTPADLLTHLEGKGLYIPNRAHALGILNRIYYYRLLIYMRPLQDSNTKQFIFGVRFEDIVNLYEFDRALRLHCLSAIERVEVALRAALVNTLTTQYSPHFYLDKQHFATPQGCSEFKKKIQEAKIQGKNLGIKHYFSSYTRPKSPPFWVVLEAVTFGTLSRLFSNLSIANQKLVAKEFNYDRQILVSWFRSLNGLRNMCAHHDRVWNATSNPDAPKIAKRVQTEFPANTATFCARAVVLGALMREIDPYSSWRAELRKLIMNHPFVSPAAMGFQPGWDQQNFWKN